jgi:hypothetical protein
VSFPAGCVHVPELRSVMRITHIFAKDAIQHAFREKLCVAGVWAQTQRRGPRATVCRGVGSGRVTRFDGVGREKSTNRRLLIHPKSSILSEALALCTPTRHPFIEDTPSGGPRRGASQGRHPQQSHPGMCNKPTGATKPYRGNPTCGIQGGLLQPSCNGPTHLPLCRLVSSWLCALGGASGLRLWCFWRCVLSYLK